MIIFCTQSVQEIPSCLALLGHWHSGEKSILLTNDYSFSKSQFAEQLVSNGVFSSVIFMRFAFEDKRNRTLEELEIDILKKLDGLFAENMVELYKSKIIYTICDLCNESAIYFSMKGVPYIQIEACSGQFDINGRYEGLASIITQNYAAVHRKYDALYGTENRYVIKRLRSKKTELFSPNHSHENEKDEWIDFNHLFNTLPNEFRLKLLPSLNPSHLCLSDERSCLILNNSLGMSMQHSKMGHHNVNILYQVMADYYAPGYALFVKEHPKNHDHYLRYYVENTGEIESIVPFEFYGLIQGFSAQRALSIVTHAARRAPFITENILLGWSYFSHFALQHKTFSLFSLAQEVATPSTAFYATGINMEFLGNFVKYVFPEFTIKDLKDRPKDTNADKDAFIIVGSISAQNGDEIVNILENATENTKVVLLNVTNVKNQGSVMPPNFVPITITKKATKEEGFLDCLDSELFYFYSPSQTIRETVQAFTLEKTLKQTKLHLSARALPPVNATQHASIANFIDSWGYHTEKDNPILKQLQLRGKFEKDYPVNLAENDDPSSLKIQLLGELLAKQDLSQKANALEKQIETLKCEKSNIASKIEELIAENKRLSTENTAIIAKNTSLIAENAILMRDIESLRLPRWLGHFLSNLHPKKKNRQRFREKYVKGKKN